MSMIGRLIEKHISRALVKRARQRQDEMYDMLKRPDDKDADERGFVNEQCENNTFTLHKCMNGHMLEVWDENPVTTTNNNGLTRIGTSGRTQKLYIVPEGEDVIAAVARALVANRLGK